MLDEPGCGRPCDLVERAGLAEQVGRAGDDLDAMWTTEECCCLPIQREYTQVLATDQE